MDKKKIRDLWGEMSKKDFGDIFGVSPRTVEGWEQGRKPSKTAMIILNSLDYK